MLNNNRNRILAVGFAIVALLATALPAAAASVTLKNNTGVAMYHLYVSSTGDDEWGPDQLGWRVLQPGDTFTLTDITPGAYDLELQAREGQGCIDPNVHIRPGHQYVDLTLNWLFANCE